MANSSDNHLSDEDASRLFAALSSEIHTHFGITEATSVFRAAGLSPIGVQKHWQPLLGQLEDQFRGLSQDGKNRTVRILAQRLMRMSEHRPDVRQSVESLLNAHGFQFVGDAFIPIDFFDPRETKFVPASSTIDFSTALTRLVTGDLDGALSAACGAVDTVVSDIYRQHSLGDVAQDSFQKKISRAVDASGALSELQSQLAELGWDDKDAKMFCQNLKGAINQTAYVMQSLRSRMSDVHGHKPVLDAVVFDSLKFASVIVSLMK